MRLDEEQEGQEEDDEAIDFPIHPRQSKREEWKEAPILEQVSRENTMSFGTQLTQQRREKEEAVMQSEVSDDFYVNTGRSH